VRDNNWHIVTDRSRTVRTVDGDGDCGRPVARRAVGYVVPGRTHHLVVAVDEEVVEVLAVAVHVDAVDEPLVHGDGRVDGVERADERDASGRVEPQKRVVQRRRSAVRRRVVVQRYVVRTL